MTAADLQAHPVAALFPMMAEDELADLAADIAERGLLHAIVLDSEGRILDGRNRYAACKIAGYEPLFVTYTRDDPAGYALAVNLARRNLTKGQAAMITAKAISQGAAYRNYTDGPSKGYISHAAIVLKYAPGLAEAVVAGATSLDAAYDEARKRKAEDEGDEARLAVLRSKRPDLADKVVDGELTLTAAIAAESADAHAARRDIDQAERAAAQIVTTTQTAVSTIVIGSRQGATGLIDKQMIAALRAAIDRLEEEL